MITSDILSVDAGRKMMVTDGSNIADGDYTRAIYAGETVPALEVKSESTGKVATFAKFLRHTDDEGELIATVFVPTQHTLNRLPGLKGWQLHVLND